MLTYRMSLAGGQATATGGVPWAGLVGVTALARAVAMPLLLHAAALTEAPAET